MQFDYYLDREFLIDLSNWFRVERVDGRNVVNFVSLSNSCNSRQRPPSFGIGNFYFAATVYCILAFQRSLVLQGLNVHCDTLLNDLAGKTPYPIFREVLDVHHPLSDMMRDAGLTLNDYYERGMFAASLRKAANVLYPNAEKLLKSNPLPIFNADSLLAEAILSDFRRRVEVEIHRHDAAGIGMDGVKDYLEDQFFYDFNKYFGAQSKRVTLKKTSPEKKQEVFLNGFDKNDGKFATILAFMIAAEYCMQNVFGQECTSLFCNSGCWPYLKCCGERLETTETVDLPHAIALKTRENLKEAGFESVDMSAWRNSCCKNSERYAPLPLDTHLRQILNGRGWNVLDEDANLILRKKIGHKKRAMFALLAEVLEIIAM